MNRKIKSHKKTGEGVFYMERNHSDNIRCIEKGQPEYPEKLKAYDHMPEKLYIKGRLPDPERPCAAVVGARMCSPYGRIQAFQ